MVWLHYCTVWAPDNLCVSSVTEPQELCLALIISLEKMSVIQLEKKNMHRCFRAKRKDWSRGECPPNRHAAANHGQHFPPRYLHWGRPHDYSPQGNIYSYPPGKEHPQWTVTQRRRDVLCKVLILGRDYFWGGGVNISFYWRIIALQCCGGLCHASIQIGHNYIYIPSLLSLPPHWEFYYGCWSYLK